MKKIVYVFIVLAVIAGSIAGANYFFIGDKLSEAIKSDSRNAGIEASAHYENYISPSVLVFNLKNVSDSNSPADVFRVFLQFASSMKDKSFEKIIIAHQGTQKFQLKGEFFKGLGEDFGDQNPVYTIRTFPENVYRPDGTQAFETWTGGIIGVLGEQMKDFTKFHQEWYIEDMVSAATKQ